MDKRQELIAALRSGKYKQVRGVLKQGDCHCALGVACDISGLGKWDGDFFEAFDGHTYMRDSPLDVDVLFGLAASRLVHFNDAIGLTFEQLAIAMEQVPELFFVE